MKGFYPDGSFIFGRFSFPVVRATAITCPDFDCVKEEDRGDKQERVSCYNCIHRQWTASSFICLKQKKDSI